MFVFVDESGNTGGNLFDVAQPFFTTGALITKSDFDAIYARRVFGFARALGVEILHANELGFEQIERIAA
ncbi:MAG: DUF3800 domain-containing protein, partial [Candidatus Methylomirabilis sp.]|nr:DUF3800 domain-containing protein [Deltaproteobacteria bacterium]